MNLVALMLDGPTFPPGPEEVVCIFLPPAAIFASWFLTHGRIRAPAVAAAICCISAIFVLQPVIQGALAWHYDEFYDLQQAAVFLYCALGPFLCLAAFWLKSDKLPNQSPEPGRSARGTRPTLAKKL